MKKINFNQLSMSWNEKQMPQKFRRYAGMLIMLLTLGVGQMWAGPTFSGGYAYFYNKGGWSDASKQLCIGRDKWGDDWTEVRTMTAIDNTKLWYNSLPTSGWGDATYMAVIGNSSAWGSNNWGSGNLTNANHRTAAVSLGDWGFGSGNVNMLTPASGSNDATLTLSYVGNSSSSLNLSQTFQVQVSTDGGSSYSDPATSPVSVSFSSYTFSNYTTCGTESSGSLSGTTVSDSKDAGYTATTSLSYSSLNGDYDFVCWHDGTSSVGTGTSYTYYPTAATTITARVKLKQFTVSYGVCSTTRNGSITLNSGSAVTTTGSSTLNKGTSLSFTATPSSGYQVEGWYSDAACSSKIQSGGTSYNAGTLTADITVYVKFEVRTGGTVTLTAGTGGQVSLDNSNWGASKAKSEITTATAFYIYAQASTGYTFSAWAKSSGSGTITSTSSASTTFTPVAYEDATVTASFTENKHNVTVQYRCGTAVIKSNTTASNVGEVTPSSQTAPAIDGYTFNTWAIEGGVTKTSGNLTDATLYFKTNSSGTYTITANYTANACNLTKLSAAKDGNETDKGAMTFDETTKAYYKDVTTDAGPYYFRFTMGTAKYCSNWKDSKYDSGKAVGANTSGSKVDCDQNVSGWGNKPAMYYPGAVGSKLRVWFDYQNKKVWTTASLNEQYVLRGSTYANDATLGGMPGWSATTSFFDGLASGNTGTITATLSASTKYKFKLMDMFTGTWYGSSSGEQEVADGTKYDIGSGDNFYFTSTIAGTYTFTIDKTSGTKVKVDFPVSYQLNYAIGSVAGTSGSISSSPTTATGSYVASGNTVTLTAPDEKTGYSWEGWYPNSDGTGVQQCSTKAYAVTMNADKTVYACYTENMHTVTVAKDATGGGNISTTSVSAGIATASATITATPANLAWRFKNWTVPDGVTIASGSETTASITINATEDSKTITANFEPRYGLVGSRMDGTTADGMPLWNNAEAADFVVTSFTDKDNMSLTCTRTLIANSDYKFQVWDRESTARRGGDSDAKMTLGDNWKLTGSAVISFDTKGAGDYTFQITKIDNSNYQPSIQINAVTSYSVTFGYGTGGSAVTATVEDATTITSGQYAAEGKDITFTQTPAAGYTFKGWYDAASGGSAIASMASDNVYDDIAGNANIYAQYTEDMHTVTLVADGAFGTAHVTGGVATSGSAGIATSLAITAEPVSGNRFIRWTQTGGTGTAVIANDRSASTTVTVTGGDVTLTAEMGSNWVIGGNADIFGNWDMANGHSFGNFEDNVGYVDITLPANTTYEVKVYDHGNSSWWGYTTDGIKTVDYTHNRGAALTFGMGGDYKNLQIVTAGHGTYRFTWNVTETQLTVTYPTSYTVTYNTLTWKGTNGEVKEISTTGGSLTSVVDNDDLDFTSGKYVVATGSVTFTASPATNYSLEGWYSDESCETAYVNDEGGATIGENTLTLSSFTADKTVYAKFAENMTTIAISHNEHGEVQLSSTPVTSITAGAVTTRSITAVPDEGYYFAGWTVAPAEGADYTVSGTGEANTTITVTGLGGGETEGQTLTANFVELDKIYFRNENETTGGKLWDEDNIYVYYTVGWGKNGSEYDGVTTSVNTKYAQMAPISSGSKIYWAYVPRSFTNTIGDGTGAVAFSNKWMGTGAYPASPYGTFNKNQGVYRTDYCKHLNMYVPACKESVYSNETSYRSNGFWMKYDNRSGQDAGYYLKEGNKNNQVDIFKATADNSTVLVAQYRFQNTSNHTFFIANAAGKFYKASATITNAACTNVNVIDDAATPVGFTITPTSEGYYTFYIEQAGDTMKLSINYPISPGDYRLDYTHDTDKHLYSDVIKPDNASSTNVKKSVYIDPGTTNGSLKLQKCTGLDASANPIWTSGVSVGTLSDIFKVGDPATATKGVYEFDMAITDGTGNSNDVSRVALSNVKLYTGPYYIKTDYAPGHWVNYKENVLNKNTITFDKDDAKTFDYYHCAWVGDGEKNVKCIIANEYNEQLTDTLIGDDILGKMEDGTTPRQYLAYAANVRFSYNSVTNELKRAYINGATDWQESFLLLSAAEGNIRSAYGAHPAFSNNDTTLTDNNNWIYMKDIQAREGARVKLTANYIFNETNHIQFLIGEKGEGGSEPYGNYDEDYTKLILGGDKPLEWHTIRVIYDFKTNKLISAWLADGSTVSEERAIETDVLVIRNGQANPTQITFANADSRLTKVDTVYSALCLTKDYLNNSSLSDSERRYYWVSFPYAVRISDIFGSFGEYGEYWIFQRYNGRKRAQYGFWAESSSNWEYITDKSSVLNAYEGYVLTLDLAEYNSSNMKFWGNDVTQIYEYFPSMSKQSSIEYAATKTVPINQEGYQCTIDRSKEVHNGRELGPEYDRTVRDSYWHLIGVPSYAQTKNSGDFHNAESGWTAGNMPFFYAWNMSTNKLSAASTTTSDPFMPMRAYLVQYSGTTITWNAVSASPSPIVARRQTAEDIHFAEFNLHLMNGEESLDHTYVRLTDDEDASEDFEFGHDLCKEFQNGANIYTMIDQLQVAGNSLPLNTTGTTIVPVGVKIAANGEYTFSMPDGTSGIGVVLVDKVLNTRTNLSVFDYTVTLPAGTHNGRFELEISPVHGSTTGIETVSGDGLETRGARKVMIDGLLYIVKDGKIFDAQGRNIQ